MEKRIGLLIPLVLCLAFISCTGKELETSPPTLPGGYAQEQEAVPTAQLRIRANSPKPGGQHPPQQGDPVYPGGGDAGGVAGGIYC